MLEKIAAIALATSPISERPSPPFNALLTPMQAEERQQTGGLLCTNQAAIEAVGVALFEHNQEQEALELMTRYIGSGECFRSRVPPTGEVVGTGRYFRTPSGVVEIFGVIANGAREPGLFLLGLIRVRVLPNDSNAESRV